MLTRRKLLTTAAGLAAAPALAKIAPKVAPVIVEHVPTDFVVTNAVTGRNGLITPRVINKEALKLLNDELDFFAGDQWPTMKVGDTMRIRKPART